VNVTVIVTTYDLLRFEDAVKAVNSLLDQTYRDKEIIVVVDRNEGLYSKLTSVLPSQVKIILNRTGGLSNSRNEGVIHANGEIIAFMDDDAIASKTWLSNLIRNYDQQNVIGVGGRIKPLWLGDQRNEFPEELFWIIGCTYKGYFETKCAVRNNFGGNFSFTRVIFRTLKFCSDVGRNGNLQLTSDDTEFSIRALRLFPNSKIIYDPDAIVYHRIYPYRLSLAYAMRRAYGDGFSKAYISTKHKGDALSRESTYLKTLFIKSLPNEVKNLLIGKRKTQATRKAVIILIVVALVVSGYLVGKLKWRV